MEQRKKKYGLATRNIMEAARFILSKKMLIFLALVLFGITGVLVEWLKKPLYIAEVSFTSENDKSGALGVYSSLASQFGIDLGGSGTSVFSGDNLIEFFKTRKIVEKTLLSPYKNKLFIDAYISNHKINKDWSKKPGFDQLKFEQDPIAPNRLRDSMQRVIFERIIKNNLQVERPNKKLSFIVIKMTDNNEEFAKDFSLMLAETAINFYTDYRNKKAKENYEVLQKQTDSVKVLLFGNIENYAESNDLNVNPLKQRARVGSQKIQVNATVNTALYTELLKQTGLAKLSLERETPLIQIIDKPILPLKTNKQSRLLSGLLFSFVLGTLFIIGLVVVFYTRKIIKENQQDTN